MRHLRSDANKDGAGCTALDSLPSTPPSIFIIDIPGRKLQRLKKHGTSPCVRSGILDGYVVSENVATRC